MIGHGTLGEAAVDVIPGELGLVAQVLAAAQAVATAAAGPAQPGNAYPLAHGGGRDALTQGVDRAHDLVTENERQLGMLQLAVENVQVGPADAARVNLDPHLSRPGRGCAHPRHPQRASGGFKKHRPHEVRHSRSSPGSAAAPNRPRAVRPPARHA